MAITVRPIVSADKTRWLGLFRDYIVFCDATVPEAIIELTWQRLLARTDGMLALSAIDHGGRIVGIAAIVFHRSTWSPTEYCYLEDLFVDPAVRGHGIGRTLIEAVYAVADDRGATRTYWATKGDNAAARRLYDRVAHVSPFLQYRR